MRAVRNTGAGVATVDVDEREPGDDEVVVRVVAAGICGTDLSMLKLGPSPVTLGHEIAGVLDDGTAVAIEPGLPCGECEQCRSGEVQRCRTALTSAYGLGTDGGMAERVTVRRASLVPLPDGLGPEDASLVEPVGVGVHAVRLGRVEKGQRVAVVGGGTVGLCTAVAAQAAGADVDLAARHDHQWAAAEQLGVGRGVVGGHDVVFEAAGTPSSMTDAIDAVRPGGTVVMVGTVFGDVAVPGMVFQMKETTLVAALAYGWPGGEREIDGAARLTASRPELPEVLITHRFGLDDATEAFAVAADRAAGSIKVVLSP